MPEETGEIAYLKRQIQNIISAQDTVQDVALYEKSNFNGFPGVTVTCSGNENTAYSSAENQRTFIFTIRIYVPIEEKAALESLADSQKKIAEEIMERVVDQLLNAFDKTENFTMDDAADNGVEAVPSSWSYALIGVGWCRVATIELRVKRTLLVN